MDNALRLLTVSTLVALLAVGCDRTGLDTIGPEGGSGGGSSGLGGSGGEGNGQHGGMSGSGGLQSGGIISMGGTISFGGASGPSGTGGTISSGGTSGPYGTGGVVSSGGVTGKYAGQIPLNHRPTDAQCSTPAAPGTCEVTLPEGISMSGPGGCTTDGDCAAGINGRCVNSNSGALFCACTYDTCMHDTDCPNGQTCACHGSPYTDLGNTCVSGNCRVDADCGAGGYCSPSPALRGCGDDLLAGYYCHTAGDLCIDDSDCTTTNTVNTNPDMVPGLPVCAYSTTDTRWECFFTGVCA
jgi:hypothetical protein